MLFIITAAGEGRRFASRDITVPKPLICIDGKEALLWSIASLPLRRGDSLIVISQERHRVRERLEQKIRGFYPQVRLGWLEIPSVTSGQLATALLVKDLISNPAEPVAIFNCDTYFEAPSIAGRPENDHDGVIPVAEGIRGDSWSFVFRESNSDRALHVAEKVRISDYASVGYYGFKSWSLFEKYARMQVDATSGKGECYVAPMYQRMIDEGLSVVSPLVEHFLPFGTPEQIAEFWPESTVNFSSEQKKVLVVDFDNTITIDGPEPYGEKRPNAPLIDKIREYKQAGYEIVVYSARNMKTQGNNVGKVIANVGAPSIDWLRKHNVPFDSLVFGKPFAENGFYVDDRAIRPSEFLQMSPNEIQELLEARNEL